MKKIINIFIIAALMLTAACSNNSGPVPEPSRYTEGTLAPATPYDSDEPGSPSPAVTAVLSPAVSQVSMIPVKIYQVNDSATVISVKKTQKIRADKINETLIMLCKNEYGISVDKIYSNGDVTVADWNKRMIGVLNTSGSTGADSILTRFLKTFFSVKGITKVKINIDGDKNAVGELYDFSSPFTVKDIGGNFTEK